MSRQTVTYEGLSEMMYGKKAQGVLAKILGHVAYFCSSHELPSLPVIVVGKGRGTAGIGIPVEPTLLDVKREEVYEFDWYDIVPPSQSELADAYTAGKQ